MIMETVTSHGMGTFYIERVIGDLGLVVTNVVVPMSNAEIVQKDLEARLVVFFQWVCTFGRFK